MVRVAVWRKGGQFPELRSPAAPCRFILHPDTDGLYTLEVASIAPTYNFSERHFPMPLGYLVLASERRVLSVTFDDDSIHQTIGYSTVEHGTTFATEDQLLINGDELPEIPAHRFYARGVPFPFVGNALLIGTEPIDGNVADRPVMTIDDFRLMISFGGNPEVKRSCRRRKAYG